MIRVLVRLFRPPRLIRKVVARNIGWVRCVFSICDCSRFAALVNERVSNLSTTYCWTAVWTMEHTVLALAVHLGWSVQGLYENLLFLTFRCAQKIL